MADPRPLAWAPSTDPRPLAWAPSTLSTLPDDVLTLILAALSLGDIASVSSTCKALAVAARTDLTKTDVSQVVDAAIETIVDSVVEGKKVSILGFGSFESRERSARQGLNPKTGEKIAIPAKKVPAFTAGKLFKERVQG